MLWPILFVMCGVLRCSRAMGQNGTVIAYDCTDKNTHQTIIDLTAIEQCVAPEDLKVWEEVALVRVLQTRMYRPVEVLTCMVRYTRAIYRCGMHSHVSAMPHGQAEQFVKLGGGEM